MVAALLRPHLEIVAYVLVPGENSHRESRDLLNVLGLLQQQQGKKKDAMEGTSGNTEKHIKVPPSKHCRIRTECMHAAAGQRRR